MTDNPEAVEVTREDFENACALIELMKPGTSMVNVAAKFLASHRIASSAPPAEPVAWQWRYRSITGGGWEPWRDGRKPAFRGDAYEAEERPLYAAPTPPAVDDGLVKRLRACVNSAPSNKTVTLSWDSADKILQILEALTTRTKGAEESSGLTKEDYEDIYGWGGQDGLY